MPYFQASELLKNTEAPLEELLDSLESLSKEYGYIAGSISLGLRENAEEDLIRIIILSKAIKYKIIQLSQK